MLPSVFWHPKLVDVPVREGLSRLHAEGFLQPTDSRTPLAFADFDEAQMFDVYDIVGTLEGTAARTVAGMSVRERKDVAASMDECTARFGGVVASRPHDFDALFHAHRQFHDVLTTA